VKLLEFFGILELASTVSLASLPILSQFSGNWTHTLLFFSIIFVFFSQLHILSAEHSGGVYVGAYSTLGWRGPRRRGDTLAWFSCIVWSSYPLAPCPLMNFRPGPPLAIRSSTHEEIFWRIVTPHNAAAFAHFLAKHNI